MKGTLTRAAARTQREQQVLAQALRAPMTPRWIFTLQGWNAYVREDLKAPDLQDCAPAGTKVASDDPRKRYHGHLLLVPHDEFDAALLKTHRLLWANRNRREGLMDRVIDGPPGTGKTFLLRVIGRDFQRTIEEHHKDRIPAAPPTCPAPCTTSWNAPGHNCCSPTASKAPSRTNSARLSTTSTS
ncbi:hypothetical protein [Streptomyces noursei]|uniref:hypothetical protein n=1 Tax=Streptomyces noursei TaxID=1971 RepID=UPI0030F201AB